MAKTDTKNKLSVKVGDIDYSIPFVWTPSTINASGYNFANGYDGRLYDDGGKEDIYDMSAKVGNNNYPARMMLINGKKTPVFLVDDNRMYAVGDNKKPFEIWSKYSLPEVIVSAKPDSVTRDDENQRLIYNKGSMKNANGDYYNTRSDDYDDHLRSRDDIDKVMIGTLALGTAPITIPQIAESVGTAAWNNIYGNLVRQYIYGGLVGSITDAATYGITGDTLLNFASNAIYNFSKNNLGLSNFTSSLAGDLIGSFANPMSLYDPTNSCVLNRYTNYLTSGKTARKLDNFYRYGLSSTAGIGATDLLGRGVGLDENDRSKLDVLGAGLGLGSLYFVKKILPKLNPLYIKLANIYNWKIPFTDIKTSDKLLRPFETAYAKYNNMYGIHNLSADERLIRSGVNDQMQNIYNIVGGNINGIHPYITSDGRLFSYDNNFVAITNSLYPTFRNSYGKYEYKPGDIIFPTYRGKYSWIHTLSPIEIYGTAMHEAMHEINALLGLQTGLDYAARLFVFNKDFKPLTVHDQITKYFKLNPELKDKPYYQKLSIINHNRERWYDKYSNFIKSFNDKKNAWFRSPDEVLAETAYYSGTHRNISSLRDAIEHDGNYVNFIKKRFGFKNNDDTKMFLSGIADYIDDNLSNIKKRSNDLEINFIPKNRNLHGVIHM